MTGLSVGLYIKETLCNDADVKALAGDKIFPPSEFKDVKFPFIAYTRTSLTPSSTKDYITKDTVNIFFAICSDRYEISVKLAEAVRAALEGVQNDEYNIRDCSLVSGSESFENGTIMQGLNFEFKINI